MKSYIKNITRVATLCMATGLLAANISTQAEAATILDDINLNNVEVDKYDNTYKTATSGTGVGAYRAFGFSFTAGAFTSKTGSGTQPGSPVVGEIGTFAELNSVVIKAASGTGSGKTGEYYLLVYEGKGTPDSLKNDMIIGSSTNTINYVKNTTTEHTFNFGNLQLDTTKEYTFVFSTSNTSQTGLDGYNEGIRMNTTTGAEGAWTQGGSTNTGVINNQSLVGMQVNFNTFSIPEPTTATLSLLGLGALLLRRRRTA